MDDSIRPLPDEFLVELSSDNLKTAHRLLDSNGLSCRSKDFSKYLRYLHRLKYQL